MIRTKEITKETYFCDEDVGKIGEVEIDFLKAKVPHNPRARAHVLPQGHDGGAARDVCRLRAGNV